MNNWLLKFASYLCGCSFCCFEKKKKTFPSHITSHACKFVWKICSEHCDPVWMKLKNSTASPFDFPMQWFIESCFELEPFYTISILQWGRSLSVFGALTDSHVFYLSVNFDKNWTVLRIQNQLKVLWNYRNDLKY